VFLPAASYHDVSHQEPDEDKPGNAYQDLGGMGLDHPKDRSEGEKCGGQNKGGVASPLQIQEIEQRRHGASPGTDAQEEVVLSLGHASLVSDLRASRLAAIGKGYPSRPAASQSHARKPVPAPIGLID
jgi:hypothetical protein